MIKDIRLKKLMIFTNIIIIIAVTIGGSAISAANKIEVEKSEVERLRTYDFSKKAYIYEEFLIKEILNFQLIALEIEKKRDGITDLYGTSIKNIDMKKSEIKKILKGFSKEIDKARDRAKEYIDMFEDRRDTTQNEKVNVVRAKNIKNCLLVIDKVNEKILDNKNKEAREILKNNMKSNIEKIIKKDVDRIYNILK